MNPFRLASILLLSAVLCGALRAQNIVVVGATPDQCAFATKPLIRDLKGIGFPRDWTIAVACTPHAWESLRHKRDFLNTVTAFTYMESRTTVLNGAIYLQSLPLQGTIHITPRSVLEHEYGHILCDCDDEAKADKAADLRDSHRRSRFRVRQPLEKMEVLTSAGGLDISSCAVWISNRRGKDDL